MSDYADGFGKMFNTLFALVGCLAVGWVLTLIGVGVAVIWWLTTH